MVSAFKVAEEILRTPVRVSASYVKRLSKPTGKPPLFLFGFSQWKTFIHSWFPHHEVIFSRMNLWPIEFEIEWRWKILSDPRAKVLAWQYKGVPQLKAFCSKHGIPFHYVEDGFIRSIGLGALRADPMSLAFDSRDMYFNANEPTDLEVILSTHDFAADHVLMRRAKDCISRLLAGGLSKYNQGEKVSIDQVYGEKNKKRVLVVGQVETDASIKYGSMKPYSNNDLVWIAVRENPDAQIIYKPHPEVLKGTAQAISDPNAVRGAALVLDMDISLSDALQTVDHVYTITSLSGFEALLRGIKVTALGCPFYAGWGVTDDRQANIRRTRTLTVEEIFAAAYILYPKYFDPIEKEPVEIERALEILDQMRKLQPRADQIPVKESDPIEDLVARLAERMQLTKKRN